MNQLPPKSRDTEVFSKYLLRSVDEDGAEYFTVISTGRSGMSQSGLASFVGVSPKSINVLVKKLKMLTPQSTKCQNALNHLQVRI